MSDLFRRLRYLGRRIRFDSELETEIRFHLESRIEELEQTGLSHIQAEAQARREFGRPAQLQEESRSAWQFGGLEDLLSDLRHAARSFRRNPAFALAAIFSLALGIGVNTTIFSLTMEFLFSRPSVHEPETLIYFRLGGNSHNELKYLRHLRDLKPFADIAGFREEAQVNWRNGEDTARLHAVVVTDNFFQMTGALVAMGRPIHPGDQQVAVVSHRFWQNRLTANPEILGRALVLDGRPYTVIGVLPSNHRTIMGFGLAPDLYLPPARANEIFAFYARLPQAMSRADALARLKNAARDVDRAYPDGNLKWENDLRIYGVQGLERLEAMDGPPFLAFFGLLMLVVSLILLIACVNVVSLLLARASSRQQELAIRMAIGAGRGRVIRQMLAESLLLALSGCVAAFAFNFALTRLFNQIQLPLPLNVQLAIEPDSRLLTYSIALAVASALIAGLMPALRSSRGGLHASLKIDQRQIPQRSRMRQALVVGQLALSVLLLATGFLFLRNLSRSTTMKVGFDLDHTVAAKVRLVPGKYETREQALGFVTRALERLRAMPGVESASVAQRLPLTDLSRHGTEASTDLRPERTRLDYVPNEVGPDFFRTLQIPILRGKEYPTLQAKGTIIINEAFAHKIFGDTDPIGHTLRLSDQPSIVIGVAANAKYYTIGENQTLALYMPYRARLDRNTQITFLVRAGQRPAPLMRPIQQLLGELDSTAAVEVQLMRDTLGFALLPSRVGAGLLGSLGLLGLLLASLGLYGVLVYTVARRIREIGLRVALGARPASILRMVFAGSFQLVALGLAIGLGLAWFATQPLTMFLVPGLSPNDPLTFLAVTAVLSLVAALATLAPALRALRVDPNVALRYE